LRRTGGLFVYFLRNRSTRPSVSMIFWVPVKKGWHAEQISIRICGLVDLVVNTLPQAQVIVAVS